MRFGGRTLDLDEWCAWTQADQNRDGVGHLYANFRHSLANALLPAMSTSMFVSALNAFLSKPGSKLPRRADDAIYIAFQETMTRSYSLAGDFRLSGRDIGAKVGTTFVNVWPKPLHSAPAPSSTGGSGKSGIRPSPQPGVMRWVTTPDKMLKKLRSTAARLRDRRLDESAFCREIVNLLGLKPDPNAPPGGGRYEVVVTLYQLHREGALRRPHALSTGYADKFCGASPSRPYGSTADNRTAKAGLPEAIALLDDLRFVKDYEPAYKVFRAQLAAIAPWLSASSGEIRVSADGADIWRGIMDENDFRKIVVRRLKERLSNCALNGGPARYPCRDECLGLPP